MSLEVLQSIEKAEEEAERLRVQAQHEVRDILKDAETACTAQERAAALEHRALYQQLMEESRVKVENALKQKSQELGKERVALCKEAESRMEQAATDIFERIVCHGHR